jgi:hypothetical protein
MILQVFLGLPDLIDHKDVRFLQIPVNVATETAGIVSAQLNQRSEDFQYFSTLLRGYLHPRGRYDHVLFLLKGLGKCLVALTEFAEMFSFFNRIP